MAHTHKFLLRTIDNYDTQDNEFACINASIYTSGGVLHTVEIHRYMDRRLEIKSFVGMDARIEALQFAEAQIEYWEEVSLMVLENQKE